MGGMGMQGMQGMQGMGGQPEPEPEPEPPPDLRENYVEHALSFVAQPEVKAESLTNIKGYLTNHMGLSPDELVAVLQRSDLDPTAIKSNVFLPPEEHEDLRDLPSLEEAADDQLYARRRADRERRVGVRSAGGGAGIGGAVAAAAGMPATAAYSAVATMLGSAFMDAAGAGNGGNPLTPEQLQWAQQQAYYSTQMLSQQAKAAEAAGLRVPPVVLVNKSGFQLGGPGGAAATSSAPWTQRRLTVVVAAVLLAYWGLRSQWFASMRPKLVRYLQRFGAFCGLDILKPSVPELPPKPRRELTYGSAITVQNLSEEEGAEGRRGRKYNGRAATVRGFDRKANKYKVVLDSKNVEKLSDELLEMKPKALRKRLEEFADKTDLKVEDEVPVRQTIAAAKRMEGLAKEESEAERKTEKLAKKAEDKGEKAAPKPIVSWKERQEKEQRKTASEELQHKMVSMILLHGTEPKSKVLELKKEELYDVESDTDLRTEMRSLRTQLQTMRTALWQSKSTVNNVLQERKREAVSSLPLYSPAPLPAPFAGCVLE